MDASLVVALRVELTALASTVQAHPLVESARCLAIAAQAELDALASFEAASHVQLEANRDAALALLEARDVVGVFAEDVLAVFSAGLEVLSATVASKRLGLETALVAADSALEGAIHATTALTEVRRGLIMQQLESLPQPSVLCPPCHPPLPIFRPS